MATKTLINPDRIRKVPKQFTWIDGRLVRDGYLQQCNHGTAVHGQLLACRIQIAADSVEFDRIQKTLVSTWS